MAVTTSAPLRAASNPATVFWTNGAGVLADETDPTDVISLMLNGVGSRVTIELLNSGPTNTLAAVVVQAKFHSDGDWFNWISSAELHTGTPIAGRLDYLLTDPTTLAADGVSQIVVDAQGLYALRVLVTADTAPVTVLARGSIRYP